MYLNNIRLIILAVQNTIIISKINIKYNFDKYYKYNYTVYRWTTERCIKKIKYDKTWVTRYIRAKGHGSVRFIFVINIFELTICIGGRPFFTDKYDTLLKWGFIIILINISNYYSSLADRNLFRVSRDLNACESPTQKNSKIFYSLVLVSDICFNIQSTILC